MDFLKTLKFTYIDGTQNFTKLNDGTRLRNAISRLLITETNFILLMETDSGLSSQINVRSEGGGGVAGGGGFNIAPPRICLILTQLRLS